MPYALRNRNVLVTGGGRYEPRSISPAPNTHTNIRSRGRNPGDSAR